MPGVDEKGSTGPNQHVFGLPRHIAGCQYIRARRLSKHPSSIAFLYCTGCNVKGTLPLAPASAQ
jgi:hypothetical protein